MMNIFRRVWSFADKRHSSFRKALLLSFLRSVFGVTQILAIILAVTVVSGEMEVMTGIKYIIGCTLIFVIGSFLTSYVEQTSTLETGFFMVGDKRVEVGNALRKFPLGFFNDQSSGRISASLTTTLAGVESGASMVMIGIVSGLFSAVSFCLFMLWYEFRIGILTGVGMVAYLLLVSYQMKLSRKQGPRLQEAQRNLAEAALTFLQGIKVTKAFSHKEGDKHLKEAIQKSCDENIGLTNRTMPSQFAAGICLAVFESLILIYSLYMSVNEKDLVKAIVLIIFSFMVYVSLNQAGSMLSMIGILDAGLREIEEIEKAEQLEQKKPEEIATDSEVVFEDVSFSYGENEVLHHISATMKPRSLTALIGPSGSGKTTLCQLIPRFRDVTKGRITIGGADIRHMKDEELMEKVSMVFQKVYLFEDTILNNIRFGKPDASLEEVRQAAKAARCDDFIMALPNGYDTVLEEGGNSLSGGEKQRISIARAMIKDAPIVILDEATSALDAENEHEILEAIDELTKNKTVIMIAHRIPSVQKADLIIALKDGRIVQQGSHEKLSKEKGLYQDFLRTRKEASLWQLNA